MSELNGTSAVLERAAGSPDPVVRNVAIRCRKLQQELEGIEAFLALYARACTDEKVPAVVVRQKAKPAGNGGGGDPDFIDKVVKLLVSNGRPMRTGSLHTAFFEAYPELPRSQPDTFRRRLMRAGDRLKAIRGSGYWPAGIPLNGAGGTVSDVTLPV